MPQLNNYYGMEHKHLATSKMEQEQNPIGFKSGDEGNLTQRGQIQ